jgi:acyl-CoA reductase-like NAD-dependent aldehyde dehydrogenase
VTTSESLVLYVFSPSFCLDVGKPYESLMALETNLMVSCLHYFAGWADKINGATIPVSKDKFGDTLKQPLGICAAISPWGYPLVNAFWKMGPARVTGNCIIMKPSKYCILPSWLSRPAARLALCKC